MTAARGKLSVLGGSARTAVVAFTLASCTGAAPVSLDAGLTDASPGNHALHFDGVMDYATAGTGGVVPGNQAQTVSMWIRYTSSAGRQTIFTLRRSFQTGVQLGIRDSMLSAWNVFGDDVLVQAPLPPAGDWHHVAYVLEAADGGGSNTALLYVDAHIVGSSAASPNYLTPLSCWIGSVDGQSEFYAGDLDELRVWSVARTSDGVASDMAGQVPPDSPGLVAYFNCDAIDGTRVHDATGYGNDMTLGGGDPTRMPTLIASDVPLP